MMRNHRAAVSRQQLDIMKAFQSTKPVDEKLKLFNKIEKLFPESELGFCCFQLTHKFLTQGHSPQQVISFGTRALRIFIDNVNNNIPCFGKIVLEISFPVGKQGAICTRYHNSSFYISCVCNLLASASRKLKRYDEGFSYLNWANRNLTMLLGVDNVDTCKCLVYALLHNQEELYILKFDTGRFDEALLFCLKALEIYIKHLGHDNSVEVAQMTRNLSIAYNELGEYEKALEHNQISQNIFKNITPDSPYFFSGENDTGCILIGLGRFEEAIDILKRAISCAEIGDSVRGLAFVNMAKAVYCLGKRAEAKKHLKTAQKILEKKETSPSCVAIGFWEMSVLYEKMNDFGKATSLLMRALSIPNIGQKYLAEGSARLFSLICLSGKEKEGIAYMEDVLEILKHNFGREHGEVGYAYRNLGAAYLKSGQEELAVKSMAKAKDIMDVKLGPRHLDSLKTTQMLAETYATMRRYDTTIEIQAEVVDGLKVLKSDKQELLDVAVKFLDRMKETVAESRMGASSQSKNDDDLSARISKCDISDDEKVF